MFFLTEPKETNRDGVNQAINKGSSQQPLGGLFAGGFPVLRPAGQRDMPGKGLISMKESLEGNVVWDKHTLGLALVFDFYCYLLNP